MLSFRKTRHTVTNTDKMIMVRLRRKGFTLAFIAEMMDVTSMTVFNHTKHIPCATRRKGTLKVDKRSGLLAA
jgi:hypothetical protein